MKTIDDSEMREDYGDLAFQRSNGRFAKYKNAPIFEIDENGVRHRKASLRQLEAEFTQYSTKEFEIIIEALKIIARERGEEATQYVLAQCELELTKLWQQQKAAA